MKTWHHASSLCVHGLIASLLLSGMTLAADDAEPFEAKVGPALSAKCVACHQAGNAKGGLDLSTRKGMLRGGDGGAGLVPGKPDESPVYSRAIPHDGQKPEMPEKGEPITEHEATALRKWIEQGALWPEKLVLREKSKADASFWSVQPVKEVAPPVDADAPQDWSRHPVDRFVWAKLRVKGLKPSQPADPRTFIRRATFDLWGLPPTPEEVTQFDRDCRESRGIADDPLPDAAVERLLDRLLKSPHYGERWARHWLDVAHYADTHGFERDQLRPNAWRYRDYVIESLNADKPYDQFIREQIAGDVIAPNDPQAVIATGFLAAGPWDFVGQVETKSDMLKRAARAGDLDDMVTQVITSTMGITINCARCHDHKLDPITQQEYYSLWAVFAGVKRGERNVSEAEAKRIADEKARITKTLTQKRADIARLAGEGIELAKLIPEGSGIDIRNGSITKDKLAYFSDIRVNRLQAVESIPGVKWVFIPDGQGQVTVDLKVDVQGVPPTSGHFWDTIANRPLNQQRTTKLGETDFAATGHTLLAMHANSGITFNLPKLREQSGLAAMRLSGLVGFGATEAAAATLADFTVFVDAELKFQKLKLRKDETAVLDIEVPADAKTLTLIATDGGDGIGSDLLFIGDPKLVPGVSATRLTEAEAAELNKLRVELQKLESDLKTLREPDKVYAIVTEEQPPVIKVQVRGNPEDEAQEVTPGTISWANHAAASFGDQHMPEAQRRLALANWITHPANPLTARVLVNRLWHHHFGQGLVNTPSDFGFGGDRPSHLELLDWLAGEVQNGGWSLKRMHKVIMTSAAYRQRSTIISAEARNLDASNRLLWRQNPRRLDAESLHDAVLAVSGKLNPERGGPGFKDFHYTEAYAPIYDYITPDKPELWRRSIYRFVVRTTPHRFMTTLDCPDPANLTPARMQTTTALQALTLSNNDFMLRQSRYFATRIENEAPDSPVRIRRAFELCFQRPPTAEELRAATSLVMEQGLFALCRMLINANEFVYLD